MTMKLLLALLAAMTVAACGDKESGTDNAAVAKPVSTQWATTLPIASATAPATVDAMPLNLPPVPFNYYRLGGGNIVNSASLEGATLNINGLRYADVNLMPGNCKISSGNLTQCRSVEAIDALTLCGIDQESNKFSSMYVLFDPDAIPIMDATILRNITFSGYEDCGHRNVGAQPKTAPSSKLLFDKGGNMTVTRFDSDPPKSISLPSHVVNLKGDTTSGDVTARMNLYRVNDRYLIIATGRPKTGSTSENPGSLIAYYQD